MTASVVRMLRQALSVALGSDVASTDCEGGAVRPIRANLARFIPPRRYRGRSSQGGSDVASTDCEGGAVRPIRANLARFIPLRSYRGRPQRTISSRGDLD